MTKPFIITTTKPLPFAELSPVEFERLCLWLIEREGFVNPQHYGEAGSDLGRDIVAHKNTQEKTELWYFQCKRYSRLDSRTLKVEIDKYNDLVATNPSKRPHGIVFVTNAAVSAGVRDAVSQYCGEFGYACDFWARTELDMRVKRHSDIVSEFFGSLRTNDVPSLHQLHPPPVDFTDRVDELEQLITSSERKGHTIFGLYGMAGVGKTTLAAKLAERLSKEYSDAQLYVDLQGAGPDSLPVSEAMTQIVRSFHPQIEIAANDATLANLYRSVLHSQKVLILLDNAAGPEQVAPLVPPSGCALIVTSRRQFVLPGMLSIRLDVLEEEAARAFISKIAPRIGEGGRQLAELCGYLPLALRVAASAVAESTDISVPAYLRRLSDNSERLNLVDASITASYEMLDRELQSRWRALAVFPGGFDSRAVGAIWSTPEYATLQILRNLRKYSLVEWAERTVFGTTIGRYRLHDLLRIFADSCLSEVERVEYKSRFITHYRGSPIHSEVNREEDSKGWIQDSLRQLVADLPTMNVANQLHLEQLKAQIEARKQELRNQELRAYEQFARAFAEQDIFSAGNFLYRLAQLRHKLDADDDRGKLFGEAAIDVFKALEEAEAAAQVRETLDYWDKESTETTGND
jgi:hypothetical protein